MKTEIEIFTLDEQEPNQDELVMVWKEKWKSWNQLVFNKEYDCWDTEDGDDYACDLGPKDFWFRLPADPK